MPENKSKPKEENQDQQPTPAKKTFKERLRAVVDFIKQHPMIIPGLLSALFGFIFQLIGVVMKANSVHQNSGVFIEDDQMKTKTRLYRNPSPEETFDAQEYRRRVLENDGLEISNTEALFRTHPELFN